MISRSYIYSALQSRSFNNFTPMLVMVCVHDVYMIYLLLSGTVHAKIAYRVYIYKVIKMIHFEIATSPEP